MSDDDFRKQIYNNFSLQETDVLIEIWQKNDQDVWSEDALSVVQEVLLERLGELPQGILAPQDEDAESEDDENPPVLYDPYEVLRLEKWLHKAAIAAIVISTISNLRTLSQTHELIWLYFGGELEWNLVAWLITFVYFFLTMCFQVIIIYLPLKALASILKILMEMEFNSRRLIKTL